MNVKLVSLGVGGILIATSATLSYFLSSSLNKEVNPYGKTAKTRYPTLKVPAYGQYSSDGVYDNSFWLQKTKKRILQ